MDWGADTVPVPRRLLCELLEDGICPLHVRLQLQRLLVSPPGTGLSSQSAADRAEESDAAGLADNPHFQSEPSCPVLADWIRGPNRFTPRLQQTLNQRRIELRRQEEEEQQRREQEDQQRLEAQHAEQQQQPEQPSEQQEQPEQLQEQPEQQQEQAEQQQGQQEERFLAVQQEPSLAEEQAALAPASAEAAEPPAEGEEVVEPPADNEAVLITDNEAKQGREWDQTDRLHHQKLQLDLCNKLEPFTLRLQSTCLVLVVCALPLPEILALRAVSTSSLQWAMHGAITQLGEVCKAHHRIRTRLWIQRLEEINSSTADETVYESKVRRLADDALRRRMEGEMADARHDMENRIRDFHVEVDRRMEAQAVRVHTIVEERVQQQLDTILAAEMEKVRVLVEERVQGRVRQVVQREVYTTVCEMQAKLASLAKENEKLRTVFLEHLDHSDLCFRSLVWALSPNATGLFARALRLIWCCRRRCTRMSAWMMGVPMDRRRDILRTRLEMMQQAGELRSGSSERQRSEGRRRALAALQGVVAAAEEVSAEVLEDADDATAGLALQGGPKSDQAEPAELAKPSARAEEEEEEEEEEEAAEAEVPQEPEQGCQQEASTPAEEIEPKSSKPTAAAPAPLDADDSDLEGCTRLTEPPPIDEDDDLLVALHQANTEAPTPPIPQVDDRDYEDGELFEDAEEPEEQFQDVDDETPSGGKLP